MLVPLSVGDQVAVVATAKRLEKSIEPALKIIESWGLKVTCGKYVTGANEYWAATDSERLADLQWAIDNPEIKAIIFARGGYGTTRILDQVDFSAFKKNPKWTVGFSDLTSFLLQTGNLNVPSVHGPMAYTIGNEGESDDLLKDLLFGTSNFEMAISENSGTRIGSVEGAITGGNLSLIYESIGAKNEIDTNEKILFLEEIGEDFYSVDRMLNKLKRVGKFEHLKAVLVGDFTNVKDSNGYFNRTIKEILGSYFDHLNCPITFGFPAGHEKKNFPLLFHQRASVEIGNDKVSIRYLDNETGQ
ncbi:MAG: LD-carboxypeptidase [Cytophagia bacterium]|nr:LD-carboxypeptidase [Cytophagia bacterium]